MFKFEALEANKIGSLFFTNDQFFGESNDEIRHYGQTLNTSFLEWITNTKVQNPRFSNGLFAKYPFIAIGKLRVVYSHGGV